MEEYENPSNILHPHPTTPISVHLYPPDLLRRPNQYKRKSARNLLHIKQIRNVWPPNFRNWPK